MHFRFRLFPWIWTIVPLAIIVAIFSIHRQRFEHADALTNLPNWSISTPYADNSRSTGYAQNNRIQIPPSEQIYAVPWLLQIGAILNGESSDDNRLLYDNFPQGHEPESAAIYRAYQVNGTRIASALLGQPASASLPFVSRWIDVLTGLLLLIGISIFVARRAGLEAALVLISLAVSLFPFGAAIWSGGPDPTALVPMLTVLALLPLSMPYSNGVWSRRTGSIVAGIALGIVFSLQSGVGLALLVAVVIGGGLQRWIGPPDNYPRWQIWSLSGSLVIVLAGWQSFELFGADSLPSQPELLTALGWIGAGELLQSDNGSWTREKSRTLWTRLLIGAILVLSAIAIWLLTQPVSLLARDLTVDRLSALTPEWSAHSIASLWKVPESRATTAGAFLPIFAAFIMLAVHWRSVEGLKRSSRLAISGTPLVVLTLTTIMHPGVASATQATAIAVIITWISIVRVRIESSPKTFPNYRYALFAGIGACSFFAIIGIHQQILRTSIDEDNLEPAELHQLINRDFAHWLSGRYPDAVVWAPPAMTQDLIYFGSLRGIGTFDIDNADGYLGAVRIASALSSQEARVLLEQRQVTHVVLPAWDKSLDAAALNNIGAEQTPFIANLRDWLVPPWLKPVAYYAPQLKATPELQLMVFRLVEDQNDTELLSAMATTLTESGRLQHAASLLPFFSRFPTDLTALVAKAQITAAINDADEFRQTLDTIDQALVGGADRFLPWTSRLNLSAILARGNRDETARAQFEQVAKQTDIERLSSLSSQSLYRLVALSRLYSIELPTPELTSQAIAWLPPGS